MPFGLNKGVLDLGFDKVTYVDGATIISASNLNAIQDEILELDKARERRVEIILAETWVGNGPWTHSFPEVEYEITENTVVDLYCDKANMDLLLESGTQSVYVENDNGELMVYATGAMPTSSIVVTAVLRELIGM